MQNTYLTQGSVRSPRLPLNVTHTDGVCFIILVIRLSGYLRVLLIVQWLGVGVVFADERVDQQQEQHIEQQRTHHREVNDDGYLGWTE